MTATLSSFKQKLAGSKPQLGSFIQLPSPEIVELYGLAGFDFAILDLEHGGYGFDSLRNMLRAADARSITPLVRVNEISSSLVSRVLDLGAAGVMVPHVQSRSDIEIVVTAAKFPPRGSRGYCSGVRSVDYFSPPSFTGEANQRTAVIPMIENLAAVDNFDSIISAEGVDAVMIGPGDLSSALGSPGNWTSPPVSTLLDELVSRAVDRQVPVGMHVKDPEHAEGWTRKGVTFFTYGMDAQLFLRYLTSIRESVSSAGSVFPQD